MTFTVTRQRAQEVHDLARARVGLPYGYGGAFTRNPRDTTDCSGLVLQTAAWYGGRTDWPGNRYGSTESFRLDHKIVYDLGFRRMPAGGPGALPFKPVMLVGLQHGGGGIYSHTACTLMTMDIPGGPVVQSARGVDWESRGGNPGVRLYDGARAWNDPLFRDFWYLDAKLVRPPQPPLTRAERYALAIIAEGRRLGITPRGIKIAIAVGLVETQLTMYANAKDPASMALPHDAVGFDHDSIGIYQQRPPWGPIADRMDVTRSTTIFFTVDKGFGVRGLTKIRDRAGNPLDYRDESRSPGFYAQTVQGSAYPDRYDERWADAERLYYKLAAVTATPTDPIEEMLMVEVESWSIYADPGEPPIPIARMVQATDARVHEEFVEKRARRGDIDSLRRILRTAAGQGKYRDAAAVRDAMTVLTDIAATNPTVLQAFIDAQKGH